MLNFSFQSGGLFQLLIGWQIALKVLTFKSSFLVASPKKKKILLKLKIQRE